MSKKRIIGVISGVSAGILVGGFVGIAAASASATQDVGYPINDNGHSYGSAAIAESPEQEPDLILVVATNGMEGYVYKTELDGETPKSPDGAARWSQERPAEWTIQVYGVDGQTPLGEFLISGIPLDSPEEVLGTK